MKAYILALMVVVLPNSTGCAAIIANNALENHHERKSREIEYRHQERMKELELQEKRLKQNQPTSPQIVRDTPF